MSCIVLIGGLIGCGKSTFIKSYIEGAKNCEPYPMTGTENNSEDSLINIHKIIFDEICSIADQSEMMKTFKAWRNFRIDLLMASEYFICSSCGCECLLNGPMTERSYNILKQIKDLNSTCAIKPSIIVIEDNFYYRSMRYDWFQIAKRANIGFCEVFLKCPVEVAILRNSLRGYNIPSQRINIMLSTMEYPDAKKYKWEKYSIIVDSSTDLEISLNEVKNLVKSAANDPAELLFNEDKIVAQNVCSKNVIHQADNILRKIISKKISLLKEAVTDAAELKDEISLILDIRQELLKDIKQGCISIPDDVIEQLQKKGVKSVQKEFEKILNTLFDRASSVIRRE